MENKTVLLGWKSMFMDFIRIFAAVWVVVTHTYAMIFPLNSNVAFQYGHAAVVVFFILSGFVIALTTNAKNRGATQYATARISRLYGVLIPAFIVTIAVELYLKYIDHNVFVTIYRGNSFARYLTSFLFINEIWFFSSAPPINAPLWSLSFEFSYYVLFGVFFYRSRFINPRLVIILTLLIVGPKILIMMPIWLMGVLLYYAPTNRLNFKLSLSLSILVFLFAVLVVVCLHSIPFQLGTPPLFFASGFVLDWLIGFCFTVGIWLIPNIDKNISAKTYKIVRKSADLTFPIYVLHNPFLFFFKSIFNFQLNSFPFLFFILLFVLTLSILVGLFIEKFRFKLNIFFAAIINITLKSVLIKRLLVNNER